MEMYCSGAIMKVYKNIQGDGIRNTQQRTHNGLNQLNRDMHCLQCDYQPIVNYLHYL